MQLFGTDGATEIGAIHKKYRGFIAEAMTTADNFAIRSRIENFLRRINRFLFNSTTRFGCKNESCCTWCSISNCKFFVFFYYIN